MTQTLDIGIEYEFELSSGRKVRIIIHGDKESGLEISVNGTRGVYPTIRDALGEPYVSKRQVPH